jgi:scytalone dehydratase
MTPDEYIAMVSDPGFMGDPLLQTQHLIGMSKWEKTRDDEIVGHHQMRVGNLRYKDESRQVEEMKGHSHASNTHYYKKVDGVWKFAGLRPEVRWNEYDFEHVFTGFEAPFRR